MTWGKKSALLMLAMMVFWTALPVSACVLAMPTAGQHACCDGMTMTMASAPARTTANGSCCQIGRQNPAVPPVPLSSFERSQQLAFVPIQAALQVSLSQGTVCRNALKAPPPKSSLGSIFILRI